VPNIIHCQPTTIQFDLLNFALPGILLSHESKDFNAVGKIVKGLDIIISEHASKIGWILTDFLKIHPL
jgi:hypothetical protein